MQVTQLTDDEMSKRFLPQGVGVRDLINNYCQEKMLSLYFMK